MQISWTHIATTVYFEACKTEGLHALENLGSRVFGLTSWHASLAKTLISMPSS
jgi:hypothetical protein